MVLSPLILKGYFLTNLAVKAQPLPNFPSADEAMKAIAESGTNITSKVETAKNQANPRDWRVALKVSCGQAEDKLCLYEIDIELVGLFEVHKSVDDSKVEELVICNGPALLLGAARELLLLITSRCPVTPFALPSANFMDLRPAGKKQAETVAQ